jgi:hypothetical protein
MTVSIPPFRKWTVAEVVDHIAQTQVHGAEEPQSLRGAADSDPSRVAAGERGGEGV